MIDRRSVLKWGAVVPALGALPRTALAAGAPAGLDALVFDRRYLQTAPQGLAAAVHAIDGDVTALWFETLDPVWRKPGFVLGGITGRDALFVLETLARDRGRRVVNRQDLPPIPGAAEGPISWVIAPVHPSVIA